MPAARFPRDLGCPLATRSPASNWINSRQSLALQGLGERSNIFRKYTVLQKIRRFETVKKTFLTVSKKAIRQDGHFFWKFSGKGIRKAALGGMPVAYRNRRGPEPQRGRIPSGPPKEMVIRQDDHFFSL